MGKIGKKQVVKIADLKPYERNARTHSAEQVDQIAKSIEEFGFISPVLIDEDGNVIAGHGRIMAAQKLGLTEVPCLYIEGLTEDQKRAYILVDNRLTELGGWDMETVEEELKALADVGFEVSITGFDWDEAADVKNDMGGVPNLIPSRFYQRAVCLFRAFRHSAPTPSGSLKSSFLQRTLNTY